MKFTFHPEAEEEFEASIAYYDGCDPGLGLDFAREVHSAIQNALSYPSLWTEIEPDVRRCLTHRFPFGVLYSIEHDGIFILAVMHLHREPGYWKHRFPGIS
ncbi:MAG: type II toxin-antitoxin system RelE/ParE family toxin [Desulfovibrionales bacterium]|nr:MAG: type II toxin-antitoxin system RelE/ParE family toxin [Desulfovibrionales bacterium]